MAALHAVDDMLGPALERTLTAIDPPESDAGLVAALRVLANAIDRMSVAERRAMLGQTMPVFVRCLAELEARAAKRRVPATPAGVNPVEALRRQHVGRFGA